MSKLIITETDNGSIKYIEGEEISTSIEEIKNRISSIEKELADGENNFKSNISKIKNSSAERIEKLKSELNFEISEITKKYNLSIENINKETDDLILNETAIYNKFKENKESLEKEKVKLMAVLNSAPVQKLVNSSDTQDKFSEQTGIKSNAQSHKIVF